jgi:hypothetical protein
MAAAAAAARSRRRTGCSRACASPKPKTEAPSAPGERRASNLRIWQVAMLTLTAWSRISQDLRPVRQQQCCVRERLSLLSTGQTSTPHSETCKSLLTSQHAHPWHVAHPASREAQQGSEVHRRQGAGAAVLPASGPSGRTAAARLDELCRMWARVGLGLSGRAAAARLERVVQDGV